MHIYIHNPDDHIADLASFCRKMIEASYSPAYNPEAFQMLLRYHGPESIARDAKAGRIWRAEAQGRLVGTVTLAEGELSRMFVAPEMRGRGVGRLLAREALAWAKEAGLQRLTSWSVPFSRGFYEKLGFVMLNADTDNFLGTREPPVPYIEMALWPQGAEEIVIGEADELDAEELLAGQREAFVEQCEIYDDWDIPPMHEKAEEVVRFMRAGGVVLKAMCGGRIIGGARGMVKEGICEVGRIFVRPSLQGKSIARRLMASLEEKLQDCRVYSLYTGERSEKNIALYHRQGYAPTGRRAPAKKGGGEGNYDLIWLEKPNPWPEIHACARRFRTE